MITFLEKIEAKINKKLYPEHVLLIDNSNLHTKHKAFNSNKFYLKLIIKSEKLKNMSKIRKSIYASAYINKGDILTSKNITTKRPDIYISASKWDKVIGKIASRNYNLDEPINE